MKVRKPFKLFRSADKEAIDAAKIPTTKQTASDSFRLAFDDPHFLLKDELRPIRLQLELLKPELTQQEHNIESTIVVFGSARITEPKIAKKIEMKHNTQQNSPLRINAYKKKPRLQKKSGKKANTILKHKDFHGLFHLRVK